MRGAPGARQAATCSSVPALSMSGSGGGGKGPHGRTHDDGGPGDSGSSGWSSSGSLLSGALLALSGLSLVTASPASAAKGKHEVILDKNESTELTVEKVTDMLWKLAGPIITNLGFSGCVGLIAGTALKRVGMFLAVVIGMAFVGLQGLAYTGAITVNWSTIEQRMTTTLDQNKDGKLDEKDFKLFMNSGLAMLTTGVPSVGGFLAGFIMGLRM